jgi:hypothetical protein
MMLILALFLFGISIGLLCLGIMGAILMLVLHVLTAILWIVVRLLEHRTAASSVIEISIEDDEYPVMRDVTPTVPKIRRW